MRHDPAFRLLGVRSLERGRLLTFERRHYVFQGEEMVREVVRHPGSVAVVPSTGDDVVLIRQHRVPLAREVLEIPAGLRDHPGEPPEETARRECEEEVGYRAGRLTPLVTFATSPGFTDERVWLYLAEELEEGEGRPQGGEELQAEVVRLPWEEALRLVEEGEIVDAKTLVGLEAAARLLRGGRR